MKYIPVARKTTCEEIMQQAIKFARRAESGNNRLLSDYKDRNYSWQRKMIRLGSDKLLRNRKLWPRLPDSVEALLQLSYLNLDEKRFNLLMEATDERGGLFITKKTELAQIKLLRKSLQAGVRLPYRARGPVHLYVQTRNVGGWASRGRGRYQQWFMTDEVQRALFGDKRSREYRNAFNGTAFYLVWTNDEMLVLHDLSDKQAQLILKKLKEAKEPLWITPLGKPTVSEEPGAYLDFRFPRIVVGGRIFEETTYRKFFTPEYTPPVLYDADGAPVHGVQAGYYRPSKRQANSLGSEPLWGMTTRPLPESVVRFAEWRQFLPKADLFPAEHSVWMARRLGMTVEPEPEPTVAKAKGAGA